METLGSSSKAKTRKSVTIELTQSAKDLIPTVGEDIYKIRVLPATDGEDIGRDETTRKYAIQTISVETTALVIKGSEKFVNINGDLEIQLTNRRASDEESLVDKLYKKFDEAVAACNILTKVQLDKVEATIAKATAERAFLEADLADQRF